MAKQGHLRNKVGLLFGLWLAGCQANTTSEMAIPAVFVSADAIGWQEREGRLWLHNQPFSGWQYQCRPTGDTAFVGAYRAGKAEGMHRFWHENQQLREARHYRNGWQEGVQRGWFDTGKPAFVYQFQDDVYDGSRKEWYPDGQMARDGHYHDGQESGLQRLWYANGSLKANYVARNGRNYGFTGVKNCVNVWDSIRVVH